VLKGTQLDSVSHLNGELRGRLSTRFHQLDHFIIFNNIFTFGGGRLIGRCLRKQ